MVSTRVCPDGTAAHADLYAEHVAQLKGLRETHEINRIEQLEVEAVDIVHVNYTEKADHRSFTALITASARGLLRGRPRSVVRPRDDAPARFQEFWTFHWYNGGWRLREIEQSRNPTSSPRKTSSNNSPTWASPRFTTRPPAKPARLAPIVRRSGHQGPANRATAQLPRADRSYVGSRSDARHRPAGLPKRAAGVAGTGAPRRLPAWTSALNSPST